MVADNFGARRQIRSSKHIVNTMRKIAWQMFRVIFWIRNEYYLDYYTCNEGVVLRI